MKRLLILIVPLILTACTLPWEGPKAQAQADAIEQNARVDAAAREQELRQDEELHQLQLERERAKMAQWNASYNTMMKYGTFATTVMLTMTILSCGVGLSIFIIGTARAKAMAAPQAAVLQANLIPLDPKTHQYPLLRHVHGGRWSLMNPNDGATYLLDERRDADRQLIAAMQSVEFIGELATHTQKSKGEAAQSMSMLSVPMAVARDADVLVGKDMIEGVAR